MTSSKIQNSQSKPLHRSATDYTQRRRSMMVSAMLLACAAASCVIEDDTTEADVAQELVVENLLFCVMDGRSATNATGCFTTEASTAVRRVTMSVDERLTRIPRDVRLYEWVVKTNGNAVRYVSGCRFSEPCVFEVQPTCTRLPTQQDITVELRLINARTGAFEEDATKVTVANSTDLLSLGCLGRLFSNCTTAPTGAPFLNILSNYCGGEFRMYAGPQIPGQTYAQVQARYPGPRNAWNKISDAYDFPGITVENSNGFCSGESSGFIGRARACNECGCGPWGPESSFSYFYGECR